MHILHFFDESHRDEEDEDVRRQHYASIRSLSRLCCSQLTRSKNKLYFCDYCLNYLPSKERMNFHEEQCANNKHHVRVILPSTDNSNDVLRFRNFHKKQKLGIVVYADFETMLCEPTEEDSDVVLNRHRAYSVGYYVKCCYDIVPSTYKFYRQKDEQEQTPSDWFMSEMVRLLNILAVACENPKPLNMSEEDKKAYIDASSYTCHICEETFKPSDVIVIDHDHVNSRVRGCAHQGCNINYRCLKYITVVFHNLSCFDMHLLCRDTARNAPGHVKIIAENEEKYISLIKFVDSIPGYSIRFIDSYKFLGLSLQTLASYLTDYPIVEEESKGKYSQEQIELLKQKGIFCYEYCDSLERFNET